MASRRTRSHGTIGSSRPRRATTRRSAASGSRRGRRKGSSEGGRRVPETDWKSYLNDEPVEPRDIILRGAPPGGWPLRGFPGGVEFERAPRAALLRDDRTPAQNSLPPARSEEHTSELQPHLH